MTVKTIIEIPNSQNVPVSIRFLDNGNIMVGGDVFTQSGAAALANVLRDATSPRDMQANAKSESPKPDWLFIADRLGRLENAMDRAFRLITDRDGGTQAAAGPTLGIPTSAPGYVNPPSGAAIVQTEERARPAMPSEMRREYADERDPMPRGDVGGAVGPR